MARIYMGDMIERALSSVGITEDRVKKYVWHCRCKQRKQRFNEVHQWAEGVATGVWGTLTQAAARLEEILESKQK